MSVGACTHTLINASMRRGGRADECALCWCWWCAVCVHRCACARAVEHTRGNSLQQPSWSSLQRSCLSIDFATPHMLPHFAHVRRRSKCTCRQKTFGPTRSALAQGSNQQGTGASKSGAKDVVASQRNHAVVPAGTSVGHFVLVFVGPHFGEQNEPPTPVIWMSVSPDMHGLNVHWMYNQKAIRVRALDV